MAQTFRELIQSSTPVLVDFYADWCGPCQMMKPVLKELKEKMQDAVTIVKVDVDRNEETARELGIQSIPTLILFREGKILWRQSGVVPAAQLEQVIKKAV